MTKQEQIEQMTRITCQMYCRQYEKRCAGVAECNYKCLHYQRCEALYDVGYSKKSEVVDEFAERLKEAPIKCGLPLFGLSTKEEIEEYFDGIMLQVRDAIDSIAKEMKGGGE